jgi:glycine cleavage system H protein
MFPNDRRYTKDHEWVKPADGVATVGITDFAQKELGDIVYVELPEIGRTVALGEVLGTIESVKAVSELYAPVSGTITEVNATLSEKPETVNLDAHGAGWICRMRLDKVAELDGLMDAAAYGTHVGG